MIRAAICDDAPALGEEIRTIFQECCKKAAESCQTLLFQDAAKLLYEIEDGTYFDAFLLDIEMPDMNGLELAARLKNALPAAPVIFISSYDRYVYQSFRVQPFRFIPRDRLETLLPAAVSDMIKLITDNDGNYLIAENQRTLEKIPVRNIRYIWQKEKYAHVEKTDKTCTKIRKTLKEICDMLPADEFVWADRGHIVRIQQIERIEGTCLYLKENIKLEIRLNRLAGLKRQVKAYWLGGR